MHNVIIEHFRPRSSIIVIIYYTVARADRQLNLITRPLRAAPSSLPRGQRLRELNSAKQHKLVSVYVIIIITSHNIIRNRRPPPPRRNAKRLTSALSRTYPFLRCCTVSCDWIGRTGTSGQNKYAPLR